MSKILEDFQNNITNWSELDEETKNDMNEIARMCGWNPDKEKTESKQDHHEREDASWFRPKFDLSVAKENAYEWAQKLDNK